MVNALEVQKLMYRFQSSESTCMCIAGHEAKLLTHGEQDKTLPHLCTFSLIFSQFPFIFAHIGSL